MFEHSKKAPAEASAPLEAAARYAVEEGPRSCLMNQPTRQFAADPLIAKTKSPAGSRLTRHRSKGKGSPRQCKRHLTMTDTIKSAFQAFALGWLPVR